MEKMKVSINERFKKSIFEHGKGVLRLISHLEDLIEYCGGNVKKLKLAAIYHDVGKLLWPEELFEKPKILLTELDWIKIHSHPEMGVQILKNTKNGHLSSGNPSVLDIIFLHHEKIDGSGYYRIKELPVEVAFLSICDIFQATTTTRPYRNSMPIDIAIMLALSPWYGFLQDEILKETKIRLLDSPGIEKQKSICQPYRDQIEIHQTCQTQTYQTYQIKQRFNEEVCYDKGYDEYNEDEYNE